MKHFYISLGIAIAWFLFGSNLYGDLIAMVAQVVNAFVATRAKV